MLKLDIVQFFTMQDTTMQSNTVKSNKPIPVAERLERDVDGRLFDPTVRALAARAQVDRPDVVEAMAALSWAAKWTHLVREREAEALGLSEGRLQILFRLRHTGAAVPLGELAGMMRVSPRNVTGLVDNLERDGLVERVPDSSDRRSILARITDAGLARVERVWRGAEIGLTEDFSPEELVLLRDLCLRLVQRLEPLTKEPINKEDLSWKETS
ncbi:MAG: MarR family transcriptional regulator [Candidatus Dormibacteraeota bacterium]|nr:MarR family transcriptional regulator [Candidatus Dormibacteraeota bacterium]